MQTPQRQRQPRLIGRLFAEPWRFGFLPSVTLLMRWLSTRGATTEAALAQAIRFENSVSLAFPAAEVEALHADESGSTPRVVMTPSCIGLLGAAGTLPLHDTDRCAQAAARGEQGARAWFDGWSTRLVGLFWRAWAKTRLELAPDAEGRELLREMLMAFAGKQESDGEPAAWYAGLLRMRPVSALTIECILAGELGLPVTITSLVGFWEATPPVERGVIGAGNCELGHTAVLGPRVWRVDGRVRIEIGPLNHADFDYLLPDGPGSRVLHGLLKLATPATTMDAEICLLPGEDCIRPLTLAAAPDARSRLGYDTFLTGAPDTPRAIRYLLQLRRLGDANATGRE
ncbi:type VI secretion system protein ImpH [Pseudoduganella lurida]|uniref:Type VI secretion system protein ImpH n=1 Tax=Pseudoduganella lurida TaxID=1036180 RepID=A0A562QVT8_9BURK|nr:type VI secretion system baseplate subunit TssG [Pseudoduganella lurida]TWI60948.1 type VI secretion system protein ImpH [Pseudoduganella lurida]